MKRVLLAAVLAALLAVPYYARADEGRPVLLVYRLESERQSITSVLAACGYSVNAVHESAYSANSLTQAAAVVTTARQPYLDGADQNLPVVCVGPETGPVNGIQVQPAGGHGITLHAGHFKAPASFEDEILLITDYSGTAEGKMEFPLGGSFPYSVIQGHTAYVPNFFRDDIQPLALSLVMRHFLGGPVKGRLFLLIDQVYPFSDLGMLCHMADALYTRGYPFTVSAMPVYDNLAYPAYLRYTQVLRYVQARGGAVVMHDPIVSSAEIGREDAAARLARARAAFEQQGILLANGIVSPYPLSLEGVMNLSGSGKPFGPLPMDVSIGLPIAQTPELFDQMLHALSDAWVSVSSLQKMAGGGPFLYDEEPVGGDYVYREAVQTSFEGFFSAGNRTLLTIVMISLVVFFGLLLSGYFLYRRKFYR